MALSSLSRGPVAAVVFVCTGNTCRSPLAEVLARREVEDRGLEIQVSSAGTMAAEGAPASPGSQVEARRRGADLSLHRSRPVDASILEADLVIAMTPGHLAHLRTGHGRELAAALATDFLPPEHPWHGRAVADPFGGGEEEYERVADLLEECVRGLVEAIEAP